MNAQPASEDKQRKRLTVHQSERATVQVRPQAISQRARSPCRAICAERPEANQAAGGPREGSSKRGSMSTAGTAEDTGSGTDPVWTDNCTTAEFTRAANTT